MIFTEYPGLHGRPAAPRRRPMAAAGHPPGDGRAVAVHAGPVRCRPSARRPGDAGPDHLLAHRGQPVPGQPSPPRSASSPRRSRGAPATASRRQGPGSPGPPADPQLRPGTSPARRRGAGRTDVPAVAADLAAAAGRAGRRVRPAGLQRGGGQMLAIEPAESQVYLADDHLAEHRPPGSRPGPHRAAASRPRATTIPISVTWPPVLIPRAQKEIGPAGRTGSSPGRTQKHRAKLPASDIDPAATRATCHHRRCLH